MIGMTEQKKTLSIVIEEDSVKVNGVVYKDKASIDVHEIDTIEVKAVFSKGPYKALFILSWVFFVLCFLYAVIF